MHDAKVLALLNLNAGSIVAMDRAYNDYAQFALARTTPTTPVRIRTAQKAPYKKTGKPQPKKTISQGKKLAITKPSRAIKKSLTCLGQQ